MNKRLLVFSKKKILNNFLISPEDLNCFYSENFFLTSSKGFNTFAFIFPNITFLSHNCFYAQEFINIRVSLSIVKRQLKLFLKGLIQGFFLEFRVIGLGFKIKRGGSSLEKLIKFDIGFGHFIKLPVSNLVKFVRTKKRFMLFSANYLILRNVLKNIQNLRKHNPYKMRGLKLSGFKIRTKPGKKQNKR